MIFLQCLHDKYHTACNTNPGWENSLLPCLIAPTNTCSQGYRCCQGGDLTVRNVRQGERVHSQVERDNNVLLIRNNVIVFVLILPF